jgi:hypothetical protein
MTFTPRIHENGTACCASYDEAGRPTLPPSTPCDKCKQLVARYHLAANKESTMKHNHAPDPYEPELRALREQRLDLAATPDLDPRYKDGHAPDGYRIALTIAQAKRELEEENSR